MTGTTIVDDQRSRPHNQLDALPAPELNRLIVQLGAYALRRSRWLGLQPRPGGALPSGETVESIVSMAFEKFLSGTRVWDRETFPTLEEFLKSVVRSDLEHLAVKARRLTPFDESALEPVDHRYSTPHQLLLEQERKQKEAAALEAVARQCEADPIAAQTIELMRDGYEPREIATKLGIVIEAVYTAAKRIRRACASVGEQIREQ